MSAHTCTGVRGSTLEVGQHRHCGASGACSANIISINTRGSQQKASDLHVTCCASEFACFRQNWSKDVGCRGL